MNKERPLMKIRSQVWEVKVRVNATRSKIFSTKESEIKEWKVTEYLN
jgi:hypothetical protein